MSKKKYNIKRKFIIDSLKLDPSQVQNSRKGYDAFIVPYQSKYINRIYKSPEELKYQGNIKILAYVGSNVWNYGTTNAKIVDYFNIEFLNTGTRLNGVHIFNLVSKNPEIFIKDPTIDHPVYKPKPTIMELMPDNIIIEDMERQDEIFNREMAIQRNTFQAQAHMQGLVLDERWLLNLITFIHEIDHVIGYHKYLEDPIHFIISIKMDAYLSGIRVINIQTGIFAYMATQMCYIVNR